MAVSNKCLHETTEVFETLTAITANTETHLLTSLSFQAQSSSLLVIHLSLIYYKMTVNKNYHIVLCIIYIIYRHTFH